MIRIAWLLLALPLLAVPTACTFEPGYGYDPAYGGGPSIGVGIDYYEPFGFDYGGWGGNDRTGPPRGGPRSIGPGNHSYRPAAPSRGMPSIPTGPRRGGGGRR